jgi:hypothetical protein
MGAKPYGPSTHEEKRSFAKQTMIDGLPLLRASSKTQKPSLARTNLKRNRKEKTRTCSHYQKPEICANTGMRNKGHA